MKIFPITVKRTDVQGIPWRALVNVGIQTQSFLRHIISATVGIAASFAPSRLLSQVNAGFNTIVRPEGTALETVNSAFMTSTVRRPSPPLQQTPAMDVQRVRFDLTNTQGGSGHTVTGAWTNPTNARGSRDGVLATTTGEATAVTKTIRLTYPPFANKASMEIVSVKMSYFIRATGVTSPATLVTRLYTDLPQGTFMHTQISGNYDFLTTTAKHVLHDAENTVSGGIDWDKLNSLVNWLEFTFSAAGTLINVAVDAIELEVVARETWTL